VIKQQPAISAAALEAAIRAVAFAAVEATPYALTPVGLMHYVLFIGRALEIIAGNELPASLSAVTRTRDLSRRAPSRRLQPQPAAAAAAAAEEEEEEEEEEPAPTAAAAAGGVDDQQKLLLLLCSCVKCLQLSYQQMPRHQPLTLVSTQVYMLGCALLVRCCAEVADGSVMNGLSADRQTSGERLRSSGSSSGSSSSNVPEQALVFAARAMKIQGQLLADMV
jgi:hypothetical protein